MALKKKYRVPGGIFLYLKDHDIPIYGSPGVDIETLDLGDEAINDDVLSLLKDLPHLRWLSLQSADVSDAGLARVAQLTQLEHLDLRSCSRITDAGMRHVSRIGTLKELELYETSVGDAGLSELIRLKKLEDLNIHSTCITDEGFKLLLRLSNLWRLQIGGDGPTDDGLKSINDLHRLRSLELSESSFTDAGVSQLDNLNRLEKLYMGRTKITGKCFERLAGMTKLETLFAFLSQFTDEGLKHLVPLKSLTEIVLSQTHVTNAGLKYLKKLPKLRRVQLEETHVTEVGKAELEKALPRCAVLIGRKRKEVSVGEYDDEYFWSHTPRCISNFKHEPMRDEELATFQLACFCGGKTGLVLGYPLANYKKSYQGRDFVGPLAFQCAGCRKTMQIIDTKIHGYDGDMGNSVTIRGTGKPSTFECEQCSGEVFTVVVQFQHDEAQLDLKHDEPSIVIEDFFGGFAAYGVCVNCQSRNTIAGFECA